MISRQRARGVKEMSYRYDQDFSKLVDNYCSFGPSQKVINIRGAYVEAGVSYFILAPIMNPATRHQELERYAKEVLPALRAMTPGQVA